VATIHLPQLLYLWPFVAFFSAPLLIPSFLRPIIALLYPAMQPSPGIKTKKLLVTTSYVMTALVATLTIINFNTLIHPFTLSDNRHYMFYVFRYTILRHPAIKYLLAPIYILAFYLCYSTLSGPTSPSTSSDIKAATYIKVQGSTTEDVTVAFFLIWILSTALSLITVLWRLHVPSLSPTNLTTTPAKTGPSRRRVKKTAFAKLSEFLKYGHDSRLWLETLWFFAINAGTGYVFLYRGFEWPQEPGVVQRFMW
jgi:alpha-1,2-glucosyltransferase